MDCLAFIKFSASKSDNGRTLKVIDFNLDHSSEHKDVNVSMITLL